MKKKYKAIFSIVYLLFSYSLFFMSCKKISFVNFSYDLLFLFTVFNIFVILHFIFNIKKMYDFIYKKRYIIGLIVLVFLVFGKYNGSSIEIWNDYIQPKYKVNSNVILGVPRAIRSDEWLVSTPVTLSQATKKVNFGTYNKILGNTKNLVTLYPNLPSKDISILSTPNNIGYLFLDEERAFTFSWYFPYFVLFFATFELMMIITKNKKLYSLLGSILITLSPVVQWWQSPNIVAYGALAVVLFYYFLNSKDWKNKLLLSIIFGYSGYLYIMCMYPAWQVPYAYVFLILFIWIIVSNKEKIQKKDFLYLIPTLLIIVVPIYIIFAQNHNVIEIMNSTVYPGKRMSTGGGEWRILFTYVLDIFYPYKKGLSNPCEFSQYLSLFPIPIFYSIYVMIKNRKKDLFLILSNIILIFLTLWVMFPLPKIISRLTLIYMSTETRAQVAIGYLCIIEMIYLISNYENEKKEKKVLNIKNIIIFFISFISVFITIKISNSVIELYFPGYVNLAKSIICLILYSNIVFLFLYNHKKTNYLLSIMLIIITIFSGLLVSPINKGLSILYKKPVAKEIQKIVKSDKNAVFAASDSGIVLSNYLVVNGVKTINSTNFIPNLDLYYKLDPYLKYDDVYNRYHHLSVNLTKKTTNFVLNQADAITLNLNYKDVCKAHINYIVTTNKKEKIYSDFTKIYDKYSIKIYKTNCK